MLEKLSELLKKYRYALLVLVIGLVLMAIPSTASRPENNVSTSTETAEPESSLEDRLGEILSQVAGAGQVRVILTVAEGEEIVYQTNDDSASTNDSSSINIDTVTITDAQRNQNGLIRQVNPASYQGAVVVCQGADNPSVRLVLVDAVSKLTGLGANCISVLKMK
jgi:stage III sporulation protein AG